jgi:hypothetical protein
MAQSQQYPPQVKAALLELLSSGEVLEAALWVDGAYTPIEEAGVDKKWIQGRDVYFKLVGRIERGL